MRKLLIIPAILLFSCSSTTPDLPTTHNPPPTNSTLLQLTGMNEKRASHTATLLPNGKVLITGGFKKGPDGYSQLYFKSTEFYDPKTQTFTPGPEMVTARCGHTATVLKNGKILFTGGYNERDVIADAELYDPVSNTFASAGSMLTERGAHTATLLKDGTVLIAGGNKDPEITAEIFDPVTAKFSKAKPMVARRLGHTATVLSNGTILFAGGETKEHTIIASTEIYDPETGTFTPGPDMSVVRYKHAAVLLETGDVLIAGGSNEKDWTGKYSSAEIYRVKENKFEPVSDMSIKRFKFPNSVVVLGTKILIGGGGDQVEMYDPSSSCFSALATLDEAHYYSTATLLANGEVLLAGGYNNKAQVNNTAWIVKI